MSYNTNYGTGAPAQGGRAPRKPKYNQWEGEGQVVPRSGSETEEVRFYPFQNGGGAIHITLKVVEPTGTADQNGQPKFRTAYVPVNVSTNKNITPEQLMAVRTGMKVKVIGRLEIETYNSKKTGQKVSSLVVNAWSFEVLEMPPAPQNYYGGPGYQPQQPMYGAPAQPYGQQAYPAPAQGGYPQGAPYGQQPVYQTPPPAQGGYPPAAPAAQPYRPQPYGQQAPAYGGAPAAPAQPQQGRTAPAPYYQAHAPAQAPSAAPARPKIEPGAPIDTDPLPVVGDMPV